MAKKRRKKAGRRPSLSLIYICIAAAILLGASLLAEFTGLSGLEGAHSAISAGQLCITEICASNSGIRLDDMGGASDWITVTNASSESLPLKGVRLVNGTDLTGSVYEFPDESLAAGESVTVWCTGSADRYHAPFRVSSSGETFTLMCGEAVLESIAVPELAKNSVYTKTGDAWSVIARSVSVTRAEVSDVVISEIMASSASYNGGADYIEIENVSGRDIDLAGWYLSDNPEKPLKWEFPAMTLPAGGRATVTCGEGEGLCADFGLSSDGETVMLTDAAFNVQDSVSYPALGSDTAYSLMKDGSYSTAMMPTPGYENTVYGAVYLDREIRSANTTGIIINEVMATAKSSYDWVEIRNTSAGAVDISGWGLSDNPGAPRKWQFPAGTSIPAGGYLGVYLSGLDEKGSGGLHANFRLSSSGLETLTLSDADGRILDRAPMNAQYSGISCGRIEGSDGFYYLTAATPGSANPKTGCIARAEQVAFSVQGGVFEEDAAFTVELSAEEGAEIYYTLDCSDPTPANLDGRKFNPSRDGVGNTLRTYRYTGPISVSGTTVIRACAVKDGLLDSLIRTQSYIMDGKQTLNVVSLVSSPYNLFDYEHGIYVAGPNATSDFPYGKKNYGANFWMDWERDANVELYGTDGGALLSQGVVIRLHGNYTRAYRAKAFKVYADSRLGPSKFYGSLFPNRDYDVYKSFLLRSGGQDYKKTHFRDSLLTTLAEGTSVMWQDTSEVALYLNGEYWGQYNMREHVNRYSICQWEGWDTALAGSIDLLADYYTVIHGSRSDFMSIMSWIDKNGVDTKEKLDYVGQYIDLDNFREFIAIQMYVANEDFQNVKLYKSSETDNKWRFILFDLDLSYEEDFNSWGRFLTKDRMGTGNNNFNRLFIALMQNPQWRDEFLTYFGQQLATTFSTEAILEKVDAKLEKTGAENVKHMARWDMTAAEYNSAVNTFKNFAATRPGRLLYYFAGLDPKYKKVGLTRDEMYRYFGDVLKNVDVLDGNFKKVNY